MAQRAFDQNPRDFLFVSKTRQEMNFITGRPNGNRTFYQSFTGQLDPRNPDAAPIELPADLCVRKPAGYVNLQDYHSRNPARPPLVPAAAPAPEAAAAAAPAPAPAPGLGLGLHIQAPAAVGSDDDSFEREVRRLERERLREVEGLPRQAPAPAPVPAFFDSSSDDDLDERVNRLMQETLHQRQRATGVDRELFFNGGATIPIPGPPTEAAQCSICQFDLTDSHRLTCCLHR